jgi:hypothetical protein
MPPDFLFWLMLVLKMAVTAVFVVAATITAERAGPLIGALIATLPLAAGPAYVFLALDHDAQFIADSALTSFATNPALAIYALVYSRLAQRHGLSVSLAAAMGLWLVLALVLQSMAWTWIGAVLLHAVVFPLCLLLSRSLRDVPIPRLQIYWYDIALRAALVALFVAAVVVLSFNIGSRGTGIIAIFPIVLTSLIVILHRRVGGRAAAAVLANTVVGLVGFGGSLLTLHLGVVSLGPVLALPLALAVSVAWGLTVIGVRRLRLRW